MAVSKPIARIAAIPVVLVALFACGLAAYASETVVGDVPFAFTLGETTFPAGQYQFEIDRVSPNTVLLRSMDRTAAAIVLSHRTGEAVSEAVPLVKFNVYGEQRFVSSIQTSRGTAVTLGRGRKELALAKVRGASSVAVVDRSASPRLHF
jgi:hypothetical protein